MLALKCARSVRDSVHRRHGLKCELPLDAISEPWQLSVFEMTHDQDLFEIESNIRYSIREFQDV